VADLELSILQQKEEVESWLWKGLKERRNSADKTATTSVSVRAYVSASSSRDDRRDDHRSAGVAGRPQLFSAQLEALRSAGAAAEARKEEAEQAEQAEAAAAAAAAARGLAQEAAAALERGCPALNAQSSPSWACA
jgi:hypothetical protein